MALRPVILYCVGCFNPVTNKHLRIMELARDALHKTGKYKVIAGIYSPAHDKYGKEGLVEAKHRVEMLRLAISSNDWLRVDTWEAEQSDWTPTAIALEKLKQRLGTDTSLLHKIPIDRPISGTRATKRKRTSGDDTDEPSKFNMSADTEIKLLCGADLLESFSVPNLWAKEHMEKIVRDFGLVVISRPGSDAEKFIYESDMLSKYSSNINTVTDWISDDFSSTKVRRAIRRNESVKYVIQDEVIHYIKEHKLYNANYQPGLAPSNTFRCLPSTLSFGYFSEDVTPSPSNFRISNIADLSHHISPDTVLAHDISPSYSCLLSSNGDIVPSSSDSSFERLKTRREQLYELIFDQPESPDDPAVFSDEDDDLHLSSTESCFTSITDERLSPPMALPRCYSKQADSHNEEDDVKVTGNYSASTLSSPFKSASVYQLYKMSRSNVTSPILSGGSTPHSNLHITRTQSYEAGFSYFARRDYGADKIKRDEVSCDDDQNADDLLPRSVSFSGKIIAPSGDSKSVFSRLVRRFSKVRLSTRRKCIETDCK